MDKLFYETQFTKELNYKDSEDRAALTGENRKPLDKQDQLKIADIEQRIGRSKAIQSSYYKNEQFIDDTKTYIFMLEQWDHLQNHISE